MMKLRKKAFMAIKTVEMNTTVCYCYCTKNDIRASFTAKAYVL